MAQQEFKGAPDSVGLRILSGAFLAALAVLLIWGGTPYFELMVALFAFAMTWEWAILTGYSYESLPGFAVSAATLTAVLLAGLDELVWALVVVAVVGGLILLIGGLMGFRKSGWAALGAVYLALPCIALIWLRHEADVGLFLVVWLMVVVWATDVGAYAAGRTIGGPRLAPSISPNKTWAGLIGGLSCAALFGAFIAWIEGDVPIGVLTAAAVVVGIFAQVGDLLESKVKRHFDVKDSGNLIPGHGGVLDRVDGLLIAAPVFAIFVAVGQRG